jgi:PAS domain S-box-containing protein
MTKDQQQDTRGTIQEQSRLSDSLNKKNSLISVLYVDDEPALLDPIKHYLEKKEHFSVDTATSAKDALERMKNKKYDVIVSDYQMPLVDGIQLLKKLRAEQNAIPFIIFTGKGHEDVVVEAYDAGADFYLPKGGNPKAMFLDLTQKITQIVTRKRYEDALLESEERYRKVVEQTHDAIVIFQGPKIVFVNDRATEISGYSKDEISAMDIWDIVHPEDRQYLRGLAKNPDAVPAMPKTIETRIITKNGETRFLETAVTSLMFDSTSSTLCSVRDITERRQAEDALRESEAKYRSIFNTFDDLYYQTDMNGTITTLSPSCKRITGWEPSELIGKQVTDLYPFPKQRELLLDHMFINGTVHDYEVILKNKNGEHLNVSVTSHVVRDEMGKTIAIEGALRDITERKRVERALQESEERFRSLADFLPVMVFETDREGMLTFGNQLILPVFGVDPDHIGSRINVLDYIIPEQRATALENMGKIFSGILPRSSTEYTLIRRDDTTFPTMVTASPILDGKSTSPVGMRGVIIDLTGLKQAEKALRESEELFRTLFNNANDAIFLHEVQPDGKPGRYIMANDIACSRLGYSRDELLMMTPFDIMAPSHIGKTPRIVEDVKMHGSATFDAVYRSRSGADLPVEVNTHIFDLQGRIVALAVSRDITERKQMEEKIRSSEQRLHAIIDGAAIPLFVINANHEVIYWNRALERYSGIQEREIIGSPDPWKAFYDKKRPVLADLLVDNEPGKIPVWYEGKYHESKHTPGAVEATDFFKNIGPRGTWLHFTAVLIRDEKGEIIGALETLEDITDRKKAEEELISSENYLKTIFNSVPTALVIVDPVTYTIIDLNPAAVDLIGQTKDRIVGESCFKYAGLAHEHGDGKHLAGKKPDTTERILFNARGKKIPILRTILPVSISGREYLLENISDITDRKRAEDAIQRAYLELEQKVEERTLALRKLTLSLQKEIEERNRVMEALKVSEDKYRSLVEQTNDLIFHIDHEGVLTYISPNVSTILGYTSAEAIGKSPAEFMPEASREQFTALHNQNIDAKKPITGIELTLFDKEGAQHIFEINGTPWFGPDNAFMGFSGIARDITYRKTLQDEIAASLKEKEILLKEIHHRVKNNMQVISSLLSLQAKLMKDEKSRVAIQESQNRVMSIALVHEKLYQSKSLSQINFREYIKKMAQYLFESYNVDPEKILFDIVTDDIILPINKAIPISLIINEMLSNALKYAFPKERKGIIEIIFRKEGDRYFLTVRDNGIGLPENFTLDQTETLGLQLVNSLVGQLAGTISWSGTGGAEFRLEFTIEPSAGEHYG